MPETTLTLYVAIWYDTDVYTYWCDHILGIYSTRAAADECCLKDAEQHKERLLEDHRVEEHKLDSDWE